MISPGGNGTANGAVAIGGGGDEGAAGLRARWRGSTAPELVWLGGGAARQGGWSPLTLDKLA